MGFKLGGQRLNLTSRQAVSLCQIMKNYLSPVSYKVSD